MGSHPADPRHPRTGPRLQRPVETPRDLEVQQSTVQTAVSDIASSLAQVGIRFDYQDNHGARVNPPAKEPHRRRGRKENSQIRHQTCES